VTDIDGNAYKTVAIDKQVWMAEDLTTTRYRNGESQGVYWVSVDAVPALRSMTNPSQEEPRREKDLQSSAP
jgi:uncharacterized protein (TIGR02145 family)